MQSGGSPFMGRAMQLPNVQRAAQAQGAIPNQMAVSRVPGMAQSGGMAPGAMGAVTQLPAVQQSQGITPQMPIPQRAAGGPRFSGK